MDAGLASDGRLRLEKATSLKEDKKARASGLFYRKFHPIMTSDAAGEDSFSKNPKAPLRH